MNIEEKVEVDFKLLNFKIQHLFTFCGYGKSVPTTEVLEIIEILIREASDVCKPMFGYKIFDGMLLTRDSIKIEDRVFNPGVVITRALSNCDKYVAVISTTGKEFEDWLHGVSQGGDMIKAYIADAIGSIIAELVSEYACRHIETMCNLNGLKCTNSYSPGYCDWFVMEQKILFSIIPPNFCGVTLNDSALMTPIKSISCVMGIGENAIKRDYKCSICQKKDCFLKIARLKNNPQKNS